MEVQKKPTYTEFYRDKTGGLKKVIIGALLSIAIVLQFAYPAKADTTPIQAETVQFFNLQMGEMADYGASPWYTEEIFAGTSPMKFGLDSGSNFFWGTSDRCFTAACDAHYKVDTSQEDFVWIDQNTTERSFGPWGSMYTWTGQVPFNTDADKFPSVDVPFFASVEYNGNQFEYLDWGGGIGFPSSTDDVEEGSGFYFGSLYDVGAFELPTFSVVTDRQTGLGSFFLGGDDPSLYDASSEIELQPDKTGEIPYLWGTTLYSAQFGDTLLPSLTNEPFYLDTGASVFKGDDRYLTPILEALYELRDKDSQRIFEQVFDDGLWVSLVYANGGNPSMYADILPDFTLTMGQSCAMESGKAAEISLSPEQYSYYVEQGERAGQWVPAFTRLDGVGGLLVGSTFMDLLYAKFDYNVTVDDKLTQGNMYLYQKSTGENPAGLSCVSPPEPANAVAKSIADSISGTWHNSYCSQVDLTVDASGTIEGVYTSHTGSTGSSNVVGWVGSSTNNDAQVNPNGTPVALGIQWRLINQPIGDADGSWHWVSTFSGQYQPNQTVSQPSQDDYELEETLDILNGLLATAAVPGLTDTAPKMWPQTLQFHKDPPDYCQPVTPGEPVPFSATAEDYVTGSWINPVGNILDLQADIEAGTVTGTYTIDATGEGYQIIGLVDAIAASLPDVVEQGVALTMYSDTTGNVISMAGGVDLSDIDSMILWEDYLTSTTWTNRYMESTFDKTSWTRL